MKYSLWGVNFPPLMKMIGLLFCMHAAGSQAQEVTLQQSAASMQTGDALSMVAPDTRLQGSSSASHAAPVLHLQADHGGLLQDVEQVNGSDAAISAAVADGLTTGLAISSGAIEMNPLLSASPLGLVAITGVKIGLAKFADTLPEEDKRLTLKTTSALWGGAAINNLMVLVAAPPPLPIIAGILMGFATWAHMGNKYQQHDQMVAARKAAVLAKSGEIVTAEVKENQSAGE